MPEAWPAAFNAVLSSSCRIFSNRYCTLHIVQIRDLALDLDRVYISLNGDVAHCRIARRRRYAHGTISPNGINTDIPHRRLRRPLSENSESEQPGKNPGKHRKYGGHRPRNAAFKRGDPDRAIPGDDRAVLALKI